MKKAPWARFGIRINPNASEKPDDSRNSKAPKDTLFSVWTIQNCHCIGLALAGRLSESTALLYRHYQRIATIGGPAPRLRQAELAADDIGARRDHLVEGMAPAHAFAPSSASYFSRLRAGG